MKPKITVTEGGTLDDVRKALSSLSNAKVYVGIPEAKTSRKGEPVTNAGLMYIHTHGSALRNIPPRPVIEPAIEAKDNKDNITKELELAANSELDGDRANTLLHLKRAGTLGSNAAKRWFTDPRNGWAPNAPSTIAAKGSDRPLIDKGELRRAITHVEEI